VALAGAARALATTTIPPTIALSHRRDRGYGYYITVIDRYKYKALSIFDL